MYPPYKFGLDPRHFCNCPDPLRPLFRLLMEWLLIKADISGALRKNGKNFGSFGYKCISLCSYFVENFKLIPMSYLSQHKNDVIESYDVTKYDSTKKHDVASKRIFELSCAFIELKTMWYMHFDTRNLFLMSISV